MLLQSGKPIAFGLCALTDLQMKYEQIEEELFAVCFWGSGILDVDFLGIKECQFKLTFDRFEQKATSQSSNKVTKYVTPFRAI